MTAPTQAREFFDTHVIPNMDAWLSQSTDIRLAMNAVVSLYHMADHYWHAYTTVEPARVFNAKSSGLFRSELAKRDRHFEVLRGVAEAHKHLELNRENHVLKNANQTDVGTTSFGGGAYGTDSYCGPSIIVSLDDGTKHHLRDLAIEVKQLWLKMLDDCHWKNLG